MEFWDMIIYSDTLNWSDISLNRDIVTDLDLITVFDVITWFWEVSVEHLERVWLANRGSLRLQAPGPIQLGTVHSWTCHVYGLFEFRTSLGTSNLLLVFYILSNLKSFSTVKKISSVHLFLYAIWHIRFTHSTISMHNTHKTMTMVPFGSRW